MASRTRSGKSAMVSLLATLRMPKIEGRMLINTSMFGVAINSFDAAGTIFSFS